MILHELNNHVVTDFTCACLYYDRGTKHQTYDKKEIISMKKVFVTLLSLTMVMSLLAGCGKPLPTTLLPRIIRMPRPN